MRLFALFLLAFILVACASTPSPNSNTYHPYVYSPSELLKPGATVIIASHNFGKPSRKYLELYEPKIDQLVRRHLEAAGYKVASSRLFEQPYEDAVSLYGSPYDRFNDTLDTKQLLSVLSTTFDQLKENTNVDAVVFTDVLELNLPVSLRNGKSYVEYDGIRRSIKRQGTGDIDATFDWNKPIDAATLAINVFTLKDGGRVFSGRGGIDLTQAIDVRKGVFSKSRSLLQDEKFIQEGIDLAFHPLIKSERYIENEETKQ